MIRYAETSMAPFLKTLWREAFSDDDAYIDLFFTHRFVPGQTLVWMERGQPVAMLALLPARFHTGGAELPARYIYGVATKPEHRGRGISTALLEHAAGTARQNGELLMLVPSGEGLFSFYRKRGYRPFFYLDEITLPCARSTEIQVFEPITPSDYRILRDRHFAAPGYVGWDERAVSYAMRENAHLGGQTLSLRYEGGRHIAMLLKQGAALRVRETTLPLDALAPALSKLARGLGCETIRASLPAPDFLGQKPFGMLYEDARVKDAGGYLNLALD